MTVHHSQQCAPAPEVVTVSAFNLVLGIKRQGEHAEKLKIAPARRRYITGQEAPPRVALTALQHRSTADGGESRSTPTRLPAPLERVEPLLGQAIEHASHDPDTPRLEEARVEIVAVDRIADARLPD